MIDSFPQDVELTRKLGLSQLGLSGRYLYFVHHRTMPRIWKSPVFCVTYSRSGFCGLREGVELSSWFSKQGCLNFWFPFGATLCGQNLGIVVPKNNISGALLSWGVFSFCSSIWHKCLEQFWKQTCMFLGYNSHIGVCVCVCDLWVWGEHLCVCVSLSSRVSCFMDVKCLESKRDVQFPLASTKLHCVAINCRFFQMPIYQISSGFNQKQGMFSNVLITWWQLFNCIWVCCCSFAEA